MTFRYHVLQFLCFFPLLFLARPPPPDHVWGREFSQQLNHVHASQPRYRKIFSTHLKISYFCVSVFLNRDPITYIFFCVCVCVYLYPIFVCICELVAPSQFLANSQSLLSFPQREIHFLIFKSNTSPNCTELYKENLHRSFDLKVTRSVTLTKNHS